MKTFVISDTHFGHRNIIRYCNRPFHSVEEMNEILIHNWNSVVDPQDTVYHLGDFGLGDMTALRGRLQGQIHLIEGNHDSPRTWNSFDFVSRRRHRLLLVGGLRVLLIHMPIHDSAYASAAPAHCDYDVCLYGHVHDKQSGWISRGNRWYRNCGVEVLDYRPQPIAQVLEPRPLADQSVYQID
jgi:calcineurin-like phosphoesterase family protein